MCRATISSNNLTVTAYCSVFSVHNKLKTSKVKYKTHLPVCLFIVLRNSCSLLQHRVKCNGLSSMLGLPLSISASWGCLCFTCLCVNTSVKLPITAVERTDQNIFFSSNIVVCVKRFSKYSFPIVMPYFKYNFYSFFGGEWRLEGRRNHKHMKAKTIKKRKKHTQKYFSQRLKIFAGKYEHT